jgi:hypothetical protein
MQTQNSDKIQAIRRLHLVMGTTLQVEERMSYSFVRVKYMSPFLREEKIKIKFDSIRNG